MGCGCGERRTMAMNAIVAARRGDGEIVRENLVAMGYSVKADIRALASALAIPPPRRLRVKESVAKDYGIKNNN